MAGWRLSAPTVRPGLASRPVRIVVADEVDRFPVSAGSEGDPLALASKRQGTFWNRKTLVGSTPTLKETSAIWREWLASDMRHYQVPCHACGHAQMLVWSNVRWDKTPEGKHLPATAHYVCEGCGAVWTDADRHDAVAKGQWVATNPDVIGVAGFHIPGLLSPWVALADIVQEFLMSKNDPALLQVWTNTCLGRAVRAGAGNRRRVVAVAAWRELRSAEYPGRGEATHRRRRRAGRSRSKCR